MKEKAGNVSSPTQLQLGTLAEIPLATGVKHEPVEHPKLISCKNFTLTLVKQWNKPKSNIARFEVYVPRESSGHAECLGP